MITCDRCHRDLAEPQRRMSFEYCNISLRLCFACCVVVVTALNAIRPVEERAHRLSIVKEQWSQWEERSKR